LVFDLPGFGLTHNQKSLESNEEIDKLVEQMRQKQQSETGSQ
jgi:hypothetical protein